MLMLLTLDGKVNHSALYLSRFHKLHLYIDTEGIDVLVDWPIFIYGSLDSTWLAANWDRCKLQVGNGSVCLIRKNLQRVNKAHP